MEYSIWNSLYSCRHLSKSKVPPTHHYFAPSFKPYLHVLHRRSQALHTRGLTRFLCSANFSSSSLSLPFIVSIFDTFPFRLGLPSCFSFPFSCFLSVCSSLSWLCIFLSCFCFFPLRNPGLCSTDLTESRTLPSWLGFLWSGGH